MKQVPNDIVSSLVRLLPVVIEATDTSTNKVYNAVRMTRKIIKRLKKIDNEPGKVVVRCRKVIRQ